VLEELSQSQVARDPPHRPLSPRLPRPTLLPHRGREGSTTSTTRTSTVVRWWSRRAHEYGPLRWRLRCRFRADGASGEPPIPRIPGGPTYYDRAAWTSFNSMQASGEGFAADRASAFWDLIGLVRWKRCEDRSRMANITSHIFFRVIRLLQQHTHMQSYHHRTDTPTTPHPHRSTYLPFLRFTDFSPFPSLSVRGDAESGFSIDFPERRYTIFSASPFIVSS
jgi:hypothetical protein